jgi:hypothetical protein
MEETNIKSTAKEAIKVSLDGEFAHKDFFHEENSRVNLYIWENFKKNILEHARPVSAQKVIYLRSRDLDKNISDAVIVEDFKVRLMDLNEGLWILSELILRQSNGQSGDLTIGNPFEGDLLKHKINLFYFQVDGSLVVVRVYWTPGDQEWCLDAWPPAGLGTANFGRRVFSLD